MSTDRRIEYVPLDEILEAETNPKSHDDEGIAASLRRFGTIEIITRDDRTGRLISGHGRTETYRRARDAGEDPPDGVSVDEDGTWRVPVVCGWASADDDEARAALIALNQLTTKGGWKLDELGAMLDDLRSNDRLDAAVGFDNDDLDLLLAQLDAELPSLDDPDDDPDDDPGDRQIQQRVSPGDVWALGPHRLICGSSRDADTVARLLDGATINIAVTSPPYADRRVYDETTEFRPIPPEEYVEWFRPVAEIVAAHLADDGSWFVNIKPGAEGLDRELYVYDLVIAHVREWGWHLGDEFCWERNGIPKSPTLRFKNQWESVFQFARNRWKFMPDNVRHYTKNAIVPLGPGVAGDTGWADAQGAGGDLFARNRMALYGSPENWQGQRPTPRKNGTGARGSAAEHQGTNWAPGEATTEGLAYPGNRLPTFAGSHEATGHAAAYPVGLPSFFVKAYTDRGDTVYDPFMGSGSSLLAADRTGRIGFGVELSPAYCDIILDRWERHGGEVPVKVDADAAPST